MAQQMMPPNGALPSNVPQGTSSSMADIVKLLQGKSQELDADQGDMVEQFKADLANAVNQNVPIDFTPAAALVDSWTGSKLAPYAKPGVTAQTKAADIKDLKAKLLQAQQGRGETALGNLRSELNTMFQMDNLNATNDQRKVTNKQADDRLAFDYYKANLDKAQKSKTGKDDLTLLGHELVSGTASSRSDLGRNQATITNAGRIETLGAQAATQKGGLTPNQIHEMTLATAALVSGGNAATQSTVEALVPSSYSGNAARMEQWLTNNPTGADQQAFMHQMLDTARRERHLAGENIKTIKSDILAGHVNADKNDPRYEQLLKHHFGDDAKFDEYGTYQAKSFEEKNDPPPKSRDEKIKLLQKLEGGQ